MVDRSLIAGANAWFRAAESQRSADRILDDPFAIHLAERDPRVQAIRFGRFLVPQLRREIEALQTAHCLRHRTIDELSLAAANDGFRQLVIIGAGYDMRASRLALAGVRVIEVDHPSTQARKIARLQGLRGVAPVTRVGVDLQHEDLHVALDRAGWDAAIPTCFVAEGFVHYLTPFRFEALLASTARAARRRIVLSFIRSEIFLAASGVFIHLIKAMDEIPKLHFRVDELQSRLAAHGYDAFACWNARDQIDSFAPMAAHRVLGSTQDVAQADA